MDRPVILCGLGRVGWRVIDHLKAAGLPVAVVSSHGEPDDPRLAGVRFVRGDCRRPELLEQAGLADARGVIIATSDDLVNVSTALLVRRLHPTVRVVVRMFNQNLIARLGAAVTNVTALSVSALTAPLIALTALTGDALGAFPVDGKPQQIAEVRVPDGSPLVGRRLAEVAASGKLLVLAHATAGGDMRLWSAVEGDTRLSAGDAVVACGSPADLAPLLADAGDLLSGVRWAGWVRRQVRTARRTLADIDKPVLVATAGLVLTLVGSTAVFRFGLAEGWADGLYHTVSVVATGSDLQGQKLPAWGKVFVSGLKILGAALIAGFTALFTQYLIRAKLGGAFEARRIPDGGHVVVCGLGNVGFRCVEELIRLGQRVVAIERKADNPFAATVRRMGVAVVVGDATVDAVLRQANAGAARAVIAATESELANLEISLLVRELNPSQRVVVRLTDPAFADTLRTAAGIRLAVAVPSLAAPAFVAALYGDRVHTLLTVGGRALAVVELAVQLDDPCLGGRTLRAAMTDYRFLPLGVAGKPPFPGDGVPAGLRLAAGDRLTVVAEAGDLERLLRREPVPADRRVVVAALPLVGRDEMVPQLMARRGVSREDAVKLAASPPFVLAERLTPGEAAELVAQVNRERGEARAES